MPKAKTFSFPCNKSAKTPKDKLIKYKNKTAFLCDNPKSNNLKCKCFLSADLNGDFLFNILRDITHNTSKIGIPKIKRAVAILHLKL